jgi:hypothetical protein
MTIDRVRVTEAEIKFPDQHLICGDERSFWVRSPRNRADDLGGVGMGKVHGGMKMQKLDGLMGKMAFGILVTVTLGKVAIFNAGGTINVMPIRVVIPAAKRPLPQTRQRQATRSHSTPTPRPSDGWAF